MASYTITISCDGPSPTPLPATGALNPGDKVTFDNEIPGPVTITFTDPGVFNPSPGSTITLDTDDDATLTIGNVSGGTTYSYPECGEALGTLSGRINTR